MSSRVFMKGKPKSMSAFSATSPMMRGGGDVDTITDSTVDPVKLKREIESLMAESKETGLSQLVGGSKVRKGSRKIKRPTIVDSDSTEELPLTKVKRKQSRELPPALVKHQELVKYIQADLKVPGGPALVKLVSTYKNAAKKAQPSADQDALIKLAKKLYHEDKSAMQKYKQIDKELVEQRKARKGSKTKGEKVEKKSKK